MGLRCCHPDPWQGTSNSRPHAGPTCAANNSLEEWVVGGSPECGSQLAMLRCRLRDAAINDHNDLLVTFSKERPTSRSLGILLRTLLYKSSSKIMFTDDSKKQENSDNVNATVKSIYF